MRCSLLFPPQWIPLSPHLAGPAIHSILTNSGHNVRLYDLNAKFYNTVLTSKYLFESVKTAFADYEANATKYLKACPDEATLKSRPQDFQLRYRHYQAILKMARRNEYREVIKKIDSAVAVLRDHEAFFDPTAVDAAITVIRKACDILSSTHYPTTLYFLTPSVKIYYTIESLLADCQSQSGNIFCSFYAPLVPDLLQDQPEFIGISIGDYSQLVAGLTLAMMLKQVTKAHICIGGNLFGRYTEVLINNPAFFRLFADFVIYNEGEKPVIELIKHLEGKLAIEQVPNLIYLAPDGEIASTEESTPLPVDQIDSPVFSDLPAKDYFLPEPIYNIQASRSCYWRKCSFCTHHAGSQYAIKSVSKMVAEIKSLQQTLDARYFHFVDEAISPAYLRRLSEAIIEEGLDINFYLYARFENGFDSELFSLAHRAGLRMVQWGFEAASERVYKLMNKGHVASKEERKKMLDAAFASGVWNFLFLMFGFPTETLDEAKETVDFTRDNRHMVSHGTGSTFMLLGDSPMLKDLPRYSITSIEKVRNGFNFAHRYKAALGMTQAEKDVLDVYKKEQWQLGSKKFMNSGFREKLFLYVSKYGTDEVSRMNRDIWL